MFIREGIGVWDTSVRQVGKTLFWKCFRHLTPFTHFVFTSLNSHVINSFSNLSPDFGLLDAVTLLNNISIGIDMTHNNVHIYLWDSLFCFCFFLVISALSVLPYMEFYGCHQMQIKCALQAPSNLYMIDIYLHMHTSSKKISICKTFVNWFDLWKHLHKTL